MPRNKPVPTPPLPEEPDTIDTLLSALMDARFDDLSDPDLTEKGLRILVELCRHWQQLAELELESRHGPATLSGFRCR
jgi:hypothetical protein